MPQIFNPISATTPIGEAFKALGASLMSGPTPDEMAARQAEAALKQAQRDKIFQETEALRMKPQWDAGIASVGDAFMAPNADGTPIDYDGRTRAALPALMQGMSATGEIDQLGNVFRTLMANAPGSTDNATVRAMAGAGNALGVNEAVSIPGQAAVAERNVLDAIREEQAQPVATAAGATTTWAPNDPRARGADTTVGLPTETTVRAALAQDMAAADPKFAGQYLLDQQTPRNYVSPDGRSGMTYDGTTDIHTGAPLTPGSRIVSNTETGAPGDTGADVEARTIREKLRLQATSTEQANSRIDYLLAELAKPDAAQTLSWMGTINRVTNDVRAQAMAMAQQAGLKYQASQNVADYANIFQEMGIRSAEMQSAMVDLAFATARNSQSGVISNQDIVNAMRILGVREGDPRSTMAALTRVQNQMGEDYRLAEGIALQQYGARLQWMPRHPANKQGAAAPQAVAAAPQAVAAPVAPPTVGDVQDGYIYLGGDPANPNAWAPVGR